MPVRSGQDSQVSYRIVSRSSAGGSVLAQPLLHDRGSADMASRVGGFLDTVLL